MGRKKVADIEKLYADCECFFMQEHQHKIIHTALELCGIPYGHLSMAIRRQKALTKICEFYIHHKPVKLSLKKIKSSATSKK